MKHCEAAGLFPNEKVSERVFSYATAHTATLPQWLTEYHADICANEEKSNYMISTFQAQGMNWLGRLIGAKRVLEIGVYVGFSTMAWSYCVGPDGKVTGLEFSPQYADMARRAFQKFGIKNTEVVDGDALETLSDLQPSEPYDLIFIDANKSGYPSYLATILEKSRPGSSSRLLRPGGLVLADNILRRGLVADDSIDNPQAVKEKLERAEYWKGNDLEKLREFNDMMVKEERLDPFLLPLWDGVGCAKLLD
ncbi:O-methyltransferase family 3 [Zalerion maritima]|uniref:O-methyltransferase family 3 n=1 Tax=Zalerion maritima TaxID=339359 RepID=A0AAD5RUW4_9PEZI|nr:O-methyltransferase family 3 [Zalerion maritima]